MQQRFRRLIEEVDQLHDCAASVDDAVSDGSLSASLTVDQADFLLIHSQQQNPGSVSVYCRFGPVPSGDATTVLCRLLEINLALFETGTASLGVESENRHVVYGFKAPLASVTAPALLAALRYVAEQARQWRLGHFIDHEVPAPACPEQHFSALA
jgi:hypothetical protein